MILIGFDIGSSSVKTSIVDSQSGATIGSAFYPKQEAPIISHKGGWAEQEPKQWWLYLKEATNEALTIAASKGIAALTLLKMTLKLSASVIRCMD